MTTGSISTILTQLQSPDENERRQAIVDLVQSGDPQVCQVLTRLASQDPSVEIRYYARRALDSLKKTREGAGPVTSERPLAEAFASAEPAQRFDGLKRALRAPSPEGLALVRQGLARETLPQLKASFLVALGRLGAAEDIPVIAASLEDGDPRIRANAVEALATIGGEEAIQRIIPLMQDEDNRVKANVIAALKDFGGGPLLELLRRMAADGEVWMRDSALYALSCFDSPHALALVGRMAAQDPLERLRDKALAHLTAAVERGSSAAAEILARVEAYRAKAGAPVRPPATPAPAPPPSAVPSPTAPPGVAPQTASPPPALPVIPPVTGGPAPEGATDATGAPRRGKRDPACPESETAAAFHAPPPAMPGEGARPASGPPPAPLPTPAAPVPPPLPLSPSATTAGLASPVGGGPRSVSPAVSPGMGETASGAEAGLTESLASLLASPDPGKRQLALLKFAQAKTPADLPALLAAVGRETEPLLLASLLTLLKDFPSPEVFACVCPFLGHADDRVRANAAETLAAIDAPAASPYLLNLLEDPDNRVRANTILALAADGVLDPVPAVVAMCQDPREAFRRSGLYVMSCLPRAGFLPVLGRLLEDTSTRVRTLAFDVIKEYAQANIPGASALKAKIDERIRQEKGRDRFFENAFDQMFSGLLQTVGSGSAAPAGTGKAGSPPSPQKERQALLKLGRKAQQAGLLPPALRDRLAALEQEVGRLQNMVEERQARPPGAGPGSDVAGQVREAAELELLRQEVKRAQQRRDSMLVEAGGQLREQGARLPPDARSRLAAELAEAETSQVMVVPTGEFSVLPPPEAGIPEIFDLTMRIYQKHVVVFSLLTGAIMFAGLLILGGAAFVVALASAINPVLGGLLLLPIVPLGVFGALYSYAFWKTILTLMIREYVAGRAPPLGEMARQASALAGPLVWVMGMKYLSLFGFGLVAFMAAIPVGAFHAVVEGLYGKALVRLGILIVFALVFGSRYFPYWLVEPDFILQGGKPGRDPFVAALGFFEKHRGRIVSLYLFSSLMMSLISGTTVELFALMAFLPLGKALVMVVAFCSEVFLMPVVYSNAVVLRLMLESGPVKTPRVA